MGKKLDGHLLWKPLTQIIEQKKWKIVWWKGLLNKSSLHWAISAFFHASHSVISHSNFISLPQCSFVSHTHIYKPFSPHINLLLMHQRFFGLILWKNLLFVFVELFCCEWLGRRIELKCISAESIFFCSKRARKG